MQFVSREGLCEYCSDPHKHKVKHPEISHKWLNLCKKCYSKHKTKVFKLKLLATKGNMCQRCGYSRCIAALHFHHLVPETKSFSLSSARNKSWAAVLTELDKCVLLCANCHTEEHHQLVAPGTSAIVSRFLVNSERLEG